MSLSKSKTIEYSDGVVEGRVIVETANVMRGLLRSQLTDEGLRTEDNNPLIHIARWTQYPAIIAGTTGGLIKFYQDDKVIRVLEPDKITFEDFLVLPEKFMMNWLDAVYELNQHWLLDVREPPAKDSEEGKD